MLDLRRLNILREVAASGSFSGAATRLGFSSSAVSQQMAQLEREVGSPLLDRANTGVVLTHAGRVLLAHAEAILARAAVAERDMNALVTGIADRLRIGAFATAAAILLPDAIADFRRAQPDAEMEVVEQDRDACREQIRVGELDLAITGRGQPDLDDDHTLERIPLFREEMAVVLPLGHRLASKSAVALRELAAEPWADIKGGPAARALTAAGVRPNIVFTSDDCSVLQGVVADGAAVCLLPAMARLDLRPDVVAKPIEPEPLVRHVELAVRSDDYREAVRTMVGAIRLAANRHKQSAASS